MKYEVVKWICLGAKHSKTKNASNSTQTHGVWYSAEMCTAQTYALLAFLDSNVNTNKKIYTISSFTGLWRILTAIHSIGIICFKF